MFDPSTAVGTSSVVSDALPYVQTAAVAIITGLSGIAVALIKKYVGISADQAVVDKVDAHIEQLAKAEIAKAAGNLASAQIDVQNPIVKALVDEVVDVLPIELEKLGLGPEAIASKIVGAFGGLQAQMTIVPPASDSKAA